MSAPMLKPPPGGDKDRSAELIVPQFVLGAIATVLVGTRFYVRRRMVHKIGWDDWLILLAWITLVIGLAFNCRMVHYGFGRHRYYLLVPPTPQKAANFIEALKYQSIWPPTFIIAVALTRISICLFLLRIFAVRPVWRYGLYFMIAFVVATNLPTFVFIFISCRPFRRSWDQRVPGKCWDTSVSTKVGLYNGVVSVVIDWILASLPIVFMWDMRLSRRAKVGVCVLMSMGFFTGVTAIVRTVITKRVIAAGKTADFSWISIDLRIWGEMEILVGIIAACIPTIKPLYKKAAESFYYSWSRSRGRGSSRNYVQPSDDTSRLKQAIKKPVIDPFATDTQVSAGTERARNGTWLDTNVTQASGTANMDDSKIGSAIMMEEYPPQKLNMRPQDPYHAV